MHARVTYIPKNRGGDKGERKKIRAKWALEITGSKKNSPD